MKHLIFGNGYLGNKIKDFLDDSFLSKIRVNSKEDVMLALEEHNPEVVINCIGQTGRPNIDWCEDHKLETLYSNAIVPFYILQACQEKNIYLVNLGSGCIYSGDNNKKGWSEEDEPNFDGSFYTRSKIICEKILKEYPNVLLLRLRLPIDESKNERNLINKLLKYNKIIDIQNSITVFPDMLLPLKQLIEKKVTGIINFVNKDSIKYSELLEIFEKILNKQKWYKFINEKELSDIAKAGRSNCVLSTNKIESIGIELTDVREALAETFGKYASLNREQ